MGVAAFERVGSASHGAGESGAVDSVGDAIVGVGVVVLLLIAHMRIIGFGFQGLRETPLKPSLRSGLSCFLILPLPLSLSGWDLNSEVLL